MMSVSGDEQAAGVGLEERAGRGGYTLINLSGT